MDAGPPPRSASYTGSTPRALGRARALENDIGEEEAARPTLEQLLRSAFDDDSPVLVEARDVLERESRAPIGLSTLACWRPDVGACEELVAKRAHREAKPAAVDAEPPAPAPADAALVEPAQAPEPAAAAAPPAAEPPARRPRVPRVADLLPYEKMAPGEDEDHLLVVAPMHADLGREVGVRAGAAAPLHYLSLRTSHGAV